ncbi:MAG: replicative DNA helicase [Gemmatimonadetes bacterium]|nr:replicative DNA helicase [Gemmatimonadota bacterium]
MASQNPTSNKTERAMPQALGVERAVLGAMLIDNMAINRVVEVLGDETAFYHTPHRKIYAAIQKLSERGEPVDQVTLTAELVRRGQLDDVGGAVLSAELASEMATAANAEYHAQIVLEKAQRRRLIAVATQTLTESYEETEDVRELIDRAEQRVFQIAEGELGKGVTSISSAIEEAIEIAQRGARAGVKTGYTDLDQITSGFQPSDLIILASRPSMGKTALTLCMARNAAVNRVPVLYFSLEMSTEQLAQRLLCGEARVNSHIFRTGNLSEEDWHRLANWIGKLMEAPLYIDDTPAISVRELRAKARRAKSEYNIGLIIVDYLQLMTTSENFGSREQEIAYISRSLKALAKELDIPIVACAQLSRAVESRTDKRPQLADLRESGSLEQDADVVMFLFRPEVYGIVDEEGNTQEGRAEIILGKQRNGPIGCVSLTFVAECLRFENPLEIYREFP